MSFLNFRNVKVRIGGVTALENLSFNLEDPCFLSVIGPNGAGKSVLVKSLLGLISPTEGEISLFGSKRVELEANAIGYVPQFKSFDRSFPAKARDLVASGATHNWPFRVNRQLREAAISALDKVHASHLSERQLAHLSGGELQKIFLARALMQKRRLIILDEPATGIDSFGEADLYHILEDVQKETGTGILMVTHDLAVARHHSDKVLLLNRRQIAFGSPEEALQSSLINRAFGHSEHTHGGQHEHH